MNLLDKLALPLTIASCVLTLSTAFGADDQTPQAQASDKPSQASVPTSTSQSQSATTSKNTVSKTATDAHGVKVGTPDPAHVAKVPAKAPATSPESGAFAQSALNSVGDLVRSDEVPKGTIPKGTTSVLAARMAVDLAKATPVKAGTIDEHVYEDGRREERVHTLGGSEYCVTFESPSDPKDGIDKMQYGLHPGGMSNGMSMHTCGHRFDN